MKPQSRKRALVTGGAGFLGSHLCERLLKKDYEVVCVDNFFTGTKDNVVDLMDNPLFEIIRHDVTFPLYIEVDEIYNLACPASPIHYQHDPVQTTKTSVHSGLCATSVSSQPNCCVSRETSTAGPADASGLEGSGRPAPRAQAGREPINATKASQGESGA